MNCSYLFTHLNIVKYLLPLKLFGCNAALLRDKTDVWLWKEKKKPTRIYKVCCAVSHNDDGEVIKCQNSYIITLSVRAFEWSFSLLPSITLFHTVTVCLAFQKELLCCRKCWINLSLNNFTLSYFTYYANGTHVFRQGILPL